MKIENQFAKPEECKRLKELGIAQEGQFSWLWDHHEQAHKISTMSVESLQLLADSNKFISVWKERVEKGIFSAWSVAELGCMLPAAYDTMYISGEGWRGYDHDGNDFFFDPYKTEAECRAEMIIYMLQRNMITPEDCNRRLLEA